MEVAFLIPPLLNRNPALRFDEFAGALAAANDDRQGSNGPTTATHARRRPPPLSSSF